MEENEVLKYAHDFIDHYYQGNVVELVKIMHSDICWSQFDCQRILRGIDAVKEMLLDKKQKTQLFYLHQVTFHDIHNDGHCCRLLYHVDLHMVKNQMCQPVKVYWNLVFLEKEHQIFLYEVNISLFESSDQVIEHIMKETFQKHNYYLKEIQYENALRLKQANSDLEVLTNNVPGGIFKCVYNEELTILYMSDGFLSMFGYTREEIKDYFHDSFWEMIAPADREPTLKEVRRQMKLGKTKRIEYRVLHKDHHYVWVLDKGQLIEDTSGGCPSFYCIMIDVTQEKKIEEELRLSLERYNIIMEQTKDVIIEWDILHNQFRFSRNWKDVFDNTLFDSTDHHIGKERFKTRFHPYDNQKLEEILNEIDNGQQYIEKEVRLLDNQQQFRWWRLRLTVQFDKNNQPLRAIGIVIDIDEEKQRSQRLLHQAQQDALTGIYNKMTTQNLIKDYLLKMDDHDMSALMIIDIDNFKDINDSKGHLFGDAILGDIARRMKNDFQYTDIIGRIGGDEFIVFLRDVQSLKNIEKSAQRILDEMNLLEKSHDDMHISCSIGIALAPRDGKEFTELFQKADRALYQAKSEGKKQFVIYDESIMQEYLLKPRSLVDERIDSNENNHISGGQIAEYVFRVLYNSSDIESAVSSILEIVGLQFDVSRVYIFENIDNDLYCCNTFEWCNQGVDPQIESLKHVSYDNDLGGNYIDNFDENGIFYCSDIKALPKLQYEILAPQGIKSMLQCAIKDNGVFKGYVGFDECRQNRYWTQDQIDVLVFISEILSVFLLKNRVEVALKQKSQGLLNLLNNQSSWIYVIDPQNYQLLFINNKTKELCPEAKIGTPCYKMFMQQEKPCDFCPVKNILGGCLNQKLKVYNPYFHVWVDVDASYVNWQGDDAVMLSCHDVTEYEKEIEK